MHKRVEALNSHVRILAQIGFAIEQWVRIAVLPAALEKVHERVSAPPPCLRATAQVVIRLK
jgi:hypothetical protein